MLVFPKIFHTYLINDPYFFHKKAPSQIIDRVLNMSLQLNILISAQHMKKVIRFAIVNKSLIITLV